MSVESLSKNDICAILKTCNLNNVKHIKVSGLEVFFDRAEVASDEYSGEAGFERVPIKDVFVNPDAVSFESIDKESKERFLAEQKADEIALLAIEDPLAYEKFMASNDAIDETSQDDFEN